MTSTTPATAAISANRSASAGGLREVDAVTLKSWLDRGEAVLIDVRETDEHARERIAGARLAPLSAFNPSSLPRDEQGVLVLHCRGGHAPPEDTVEQNLKPRNASAYQSLF